MQVTPAILPHTFQEIVEKCSRIEGVASSVQIDLCDGVVGREVTWLPGEESVTLPSGFSYEFDCMVNEWKTYLPRVLLCGASRVVVHVDSWSEDDVVEAARMLAEKMIPIGIAVSNTETVEEHATMIRAALTAHSQVFIQVMGIRHIGEQGQFFDEECVARISHLKALFSSVPLQVDGAMNLATVPRVVGAGADTVIVGSYIFGSPDVSAAITNLETSVETL